MCCRCGVWAMMKLLNTSNKHANSHRHKQTHSMRWAQSKLIWTGSIDETTTTKNKNIKFESQCFDFVLFSHRIALMRIQIIRLKIELMLCAWIHCIFCVWKAACKRANEIIAPLRYILRSRSLAGDCGFGYRMEQNKKRAHGFCRDRCDVLLLVFPLFVMRLFTISQHFSHIRNARRRFASFQKSIFGETLFKGSATIQFLCNAWVPEVLESFWEFCVSFPLKMANKRILLRTEYDYIPLWCTLHLFRRNRKRRKGKNSENGELLCVFINCWRKIRGKNNGNYSANYNVKEFLN